MDEGLLTNKKYVWTDKAGKKLTSKEFFARWKQGMESVTPLQQAKIQLINYIPILIGILWGLIATYINGTWWLFAILIGSLGLTALQFLGVYQRYSMLKNIDKEVEDARKQSERENQDNNK